MKYKAGDKVRIKSLDWYNENKDENGRVLCSYIGFCKEMTKYCGKVLTIMTIGNQDIGSKQKYFMHETDYAWGFTDDMIECLVDEPQEKMVSLDKVCEWLKNTIDDDVLVKCGSVIKCMDVNDFVSYFSKTMGE
jgi:hypothetical protein